MRRLIVFLLLLLPLFLQAKYPASPYGNGSSTTSFKCPHGNSSSTSPPKSVECTIPNPTCYRMKLVKQEKGQGTVVEYRFGCAKSDYCMQKYGTSTKDGAHRVLTNCRDASRFTGLFPDPDKIRYYGGILCCDRNGTFSHPYYVPQ